MATTRWGRVTNKKMMKREKKQKNGGGQWGAGVEKILGEKKTKKKY